MGEREYVTIREAAQRLGVSADTVRRRIRRGELPGERQETPQGYVWRVDVSQATGGTGDAPGPSERATEAATTGELDILRERVAGLERLVTELQQDRDQWREQAHRADDAGRELRILLQQAQALALPDGDTPGGTGETDNHAGGRRPGVWQRLRNRVGGT